MNLWFGSIRKDLYHWSYRLFTLLQSGGGYRAKSNKFMNSYLTQVIKLLNRSAWLLFPFILFNALLTLTTLPTALRHLIEKHHNKWLYMFILLLRNMIRNNSLQKVGCVVFMGSCIIYCIVSCLGLLYFFVSHCVNYPLVCHGFILIVAVWFWRSYILLLTLYVSVRKGLTIKPDKTDNNVNKPDLHILIIIWLNFS